MNPDKVRVLVVDDFPDAAATLAYALERDGYEVRTAHDGVQALTVIEDFSPQCVLFDIDMPRLDGYELSKQLRQRYADDMVLIAVTAVAIEDLRVVGAFTVADHYFRKPIDPAMLHKVLPPQTQHNGSG